MITKEENKYNIVVENNVAKIEIGTFFYTKIPVRNTTQCRYENTLGFFTSPANVVIESNPKNVKNTFPVPGNDISYVK